MHGNGPIADGLGIFLLEVGQDVPHHGHFDVVIGLLVAIDDDDPAVLALLVPFAIFLEFGFTVVVVGDEGRDDGGLLGPVEFGGRGEELVLAQFGVPGRVKIYLRDRVLLGLAALAIREQLASARDILILGEVYLEVLVVVAGGTVVLSI